MPLQIRRGTTAEVNSITPLIGELIYDTQLKRVSVGDGSAVGGIPIAGVTTNEAKDAAAESLLAGTHQNINFTYDSTTKALSAVVDIQSHGTIEADAVDTAAIKDGSTVVLDVANAILNGDVNGNVTGNVTGNVLGNVDGNITTNSISSTDATTVLVNHNLRTSANLTVDNDLLVSGRSLFSLEARFKTDSDLGRVISIEQSHNVQTATGLGLIRTRGTSSAQLPVIAGDVLGDLDWGGLTSEAGVITVATIKGVASDTGTITPTEIPGKLEFFTFNPTSGLQKSCEIDENQTFRIITGSANAGPLQVIAAHNNGSDTSNIFYNRCRNSYLNPLAVQNGDPLFDVIYGGHDGTSFLGAVRLRATVDGAVSTGIVPAKFDIETRDTAGTLSTRISVQSSRVAFNVMPVLPEFADETAATAAVGTPTNGMMYYDSGVGKIKGYQGGAWVILQP